MSQSRRGHSLPQQLTLPFEDAAERKTEEPYTVPAAMVMEVTLPVEPTFEVSQGVREVLTAWDGESQLRLIFDAQHLELAEQNIHSLVDPGAPYISRSGGIINPAIALDVLRCYGKIAKEHLSRVKASLIVECRPPHEGTRVRALWDTLGMTQLLTTLSELPGPLPEFLFESRYISPVLYVNKKNKTKQISRCQEWIERIADRLGSNLEFDLIKTVPEIVTNLVKHGFAGGAFVISVWPTGQVELLWINRIDHLTDWPPEHTAKSLADACLYREGGGAGMAYILEDLLPRYSGILAVNYRGDYAIFHANRYVDIYGHSSRSDIFLPNSIMFSLELFATEVRDRSRL